MSCTWCRRNGDPLDPDAEGESRVPLRIDVDGLEHRGMHHAAAADFHHPVCLHIAQPLPSHCQHEISTSALGSV
jgi:hypothetical protein